MKKYIIGIPIILLLISLAGLSFFVFTDYSQADTNVSDDVCTIAENSSLSDSAQIETFINNETTKSGKEYAVIEFSG